MAINNLGASECLFFTPAESVDSCPRVAHRACKGYSPMIHRGFFLPLSHPDYARCLADSGASRPDRVSTSRPIDHAHAYAAVPGRSHAYGRDDAHLDTGLEHRQLLERALAVWDEGFSKHLSDKASIETIP